MLIPHEARIQELANADGSGAIDTQRISTCPERCEDTSSTKAGEGHYRAPD